ncbi:hypothetical protein [Aquabacterium humicola]|uniref:hypothetical protein n=1 Tax=Aquabacterium humicola TaxID=3237377 RepID=UPI0025428209|nr:hypothetical protein [Rubrivivax pictus]
MLRRALQCIGAGGAAVFGLILLISVVQPLWIEQAARELVRIEVERRVGEKVQVLSNAKLVVLAQKALGRTDAEIEAERRRIEADVPARVASAVADLLKADCECRKRLVDAARRGQDERLKSLQQIRERLADFVETAYAQVRAKLLRELRIFSGTNALAFALIALLATRRAGAVQLLLPAGLLLAATLLTATVYLVNQNWLHTIVFGQYVGFAYVGYLLAVIALLVDVAFNRARITTLLINAVLQVLGAALRVVPC